MRDEAREISQDLRKHLEDRFPGRFDQATLEAIVAGVVATYQDVPQPAPDDSTAVLELTSGLLAAVNRAAFVRLRNDLANDIAGTDATMVWAAAAMRDGSYDEEFVRHILGPHIDVSTVISGMREWFLAGRREDFQILTQYLDMAYLDGKSPRASRVFDHLPMRTPRQRASRRLSVTLRRFRDVMARYRTRGHRHGS